MRIKHLWPLIFPVLMLTGCSMLKADAQATVTKTTITTLDSPAGKQILFMTNKTYMQSADAQLRIEAIVAAKFEQLINESIGKAALGTGIFGGGSLAAFFALRRKKT